MNFSFSAARNYIPHAFLIVFTFLVFAFSLGNGFVYDDHVFVINNDHIKNPADLLSFFVDKAAYSGERDFFIYRPLAALSYAADFALWGLRPFGYHLSNIVWHICNVLLVFFLCQKLLPFRPYALLAAFLFAVHPVQVETVSWIAQRSNLLCLFFILATVLFYRKTNTRPLSLLTYSMSLLAKETGIIVLFLLPLLDHYFYSYEEERCFKRHKKFFPYIFITLLYFLLRTSVIGQVPQRAYWGGSIYSTALTMSKAFFYYVKLVFFPVQLSVDHVFAVVRSLNDPHVWAGLSIFAALVVLVVRSRMLYKVAAFGVMWFLIGLLPVSNIIPVQALMAERFLYVPLVGFCLAVTSMIPRKKVYLLAGSVVVLLLSVRTIVRNLDWKNDFTLWQSAVQISPESPRAHFALGNILFTQKEYKNAIAEYEEAVILNPQVADVYNQLGLSYEAAGDYEAAFLAYQRGLEVPEVNSDVKMNILTNLGNIYFKTSRFGKARYYYEQALSLNSSVIGVRYNLAKTYFYCQEFQKAAQEINKVALIAPDFMETRLWQEKIGQAMSISQGKGK